ncbi:uncharacterized protein LOC103742162 isoform X2 [Nannospalax galili]|uniref:uncharacterized protein LOC103742162 isoform X2 n=1 Tax=Nannospalax galili TaxID=1026970 RepID=UPI00111BF15A|nr:uncharacterized protein LOC103742162 isoform X2 [Nannospalax galili]
MGVTGIWILVLPVLVAALYSEDQDYPGVCEIQGAPGIPGPRGAPGILGMPGQRVGDIVWEACGAFRRWSPVGGSTSLEADFEGLWPSFTSCSLYFYWIQCDVQVAASSLLLLPSLPCMLPQFPCNDGLDSKTQAKVNLSPFELFDFSLVTESAAVDFCYIFFNLAIIFKITRQ